MMCDQSPVKDKSFPSRIRKKTPTVPIPIPRSWIFVKRSPKMTNPISSAKMGVKLFIIPANPDEIPVSAYVKRKAGRKLPVSPTKLKSNKVRRLFSFRMARIANGSSATAAMTMRRAPTWVSEKIGSPVLVYMANFIRMNELPQTQARITRMIQFFEVVDTAQM